jgi:general stress protein 26
MKVYSARSEWTRAMIDIKRRGGSQHTPEKADSATATHGSALATSARRERVSPELVLAELRKQHFAVLSTVDRDGTPHSAGVNYGVSQSDGGVALYVMTRRHLRKTRNVAGNPKVSLVVPVSRWFLSLLPPATLQLHGRAEILDWTDPMRIDVFRRFWMGRRILDAYRESSRRGETRVCFLKITVDPVVTTYMLGYSVWELRSRMEKGFGKVTLPSALH